MNEDAFEKLIKMYNELELKLLDEIVKHFKINEEFINSDYWRMQKLEELGLLNNEIVQYLSTMIDKTPKEINDELSKIGIETLDMKKLNKAHKDGFLKMDPSILMEKQVAQNLVKHSYNELTNRFLEISNKVDTATRDAYLDIVEKVYLQTSEGTTYQEAIRSALLELGNQGISTLKYKIIDENGKAVGIRNYDVEGAVRREILTATHNLVNNINLEVAQELDAEYLYLSEHSNCREQHFSWQGTIIKRENLVEVTRLGEVDGMGGPNCKHYPTPYFGEARGSELKKISKEEAEKQSKLSQQQRYLERGIRKWKRKERIFKTAEDKEYYEKCKDKVKEWQLRNKKFTEENNLKRAFSRENVEKMTKVQKDDIILSEKEQYAMNKYISSDFYVVNEKLRNGIDLSDDEKEMVNNLDKALNKIPRFDGIVTRSLELNEEQLNKFLKQHEIGNIIEYPAYTSTTTGERYNRISNVELYINSKNGRDIRKYNSKEQEILFKRGSLFRVKETEKIKDTYHILLEDINEE